MAFYLAFKEIWRTRGRFLLFSMVIGLITMLVLFVAALAEGLGTGNREFIQKLNGDLIVYQSGVDLYIGASKLGASTLNAIRRVDGVAAAGPIGVASVSMIFNDGTKPLNVALLGVTPGLPGEPAVVRGEQLRGPRSREAIVDRNVALRTGIGVGDEIRIKSIQATDEQFYTLRVVGVTDGQQYSLQPSVIVPLNTWDKIRPQAVVGGDPSSDLVYNVVAVRLTDPAQSGAVAQRLTERVSAIEAANLVTAYEATPGYSAQQSTLNTQRYFALLIGVLVIGGFFQILTLQKVGQIGMLKAIGAANVTVGVASVVQIIAVTVIGVAMGTLATLMLSLGFPPTVPIVFAPSGVMVAIVSLLVIGPLGGLVSVRYSLRVEPLTALGLGA